MDRSSARHSAMRFTRRNWLKLSTVGVVTWGGISWLRALANEAVATSTTHRSCILLWMSGGPSQIDTFDMKPGHRNGGAFQEIATTVPGIKVCQHLPNVSSMMDHLAIIRSMTSKEGDHERATNFVRTGYIPQSGIDYPAFAAAAAKEMPSADGELPRYVSIAPGYFNQLAGAGYLGATHAPFTVGENAGEDLDQSLQVRDLAPSSQLESSRLERRWQMLQSLETEYQPSLPDVPVVARRAAYHRARVLMQGPAGQIFDLRNEPTALRDAYGRNLFGQGCLLTRRLVERGIPFVEVGLNQVPDVQAFGWDTHADNFNGVQKLCAVLDAAWGTLLQDLKTRGLLESTLIVWMGEFGRTPSINSAGGRDHFPDAWSAVLGGGGIAGGQVYGATSADGRRVIDRPTQVPDLLATICKALNVDPLTQNHSNIGRPIRLVNPDAVPINEVLA